MNYIMGILDSDRIAANGPKVVRSLQCVQSVFASFLAPFSVLTLIFFSFFCHCFLLLLLISEENLQQKSCKHSTVNAHPPFTSGERLTFGHAAFALSPFLPQPEHTFKGVSPPNPSALLF